MSPWNLVLIPNLLARLIQLSFVLASQKRATVELNDPTRDLSLSKDSAQLLGSRLQEERLLAQGTTFYLSARENLENSSSLMKRLHWSTKTVLLTWLNLWVWSMMQWNEDFSLTRLREVTKQLFWITEINFHRSLLGTQFKRKKPTTARIVCCLRSATRNTNCWSVEILRLLKWS